MLKEKYEVHNMLADPAHPPFAVAIAITDDLKSAMDKAEEFCDQWDEQKILGVFLGENLLAIYDSNDWFARV